MIRVTLLDEAGDVVYSRLMESVPAGIVKYLNRYFVSGRVWRDKVTFYESTVQELIP